MSEYIAPLREMRFVLTELAGLDEISSLPGFEDATPDTVEAVLEEAGKFAAGVLAPLNRVSALPTVRAISTTSSSRSAVAQSEADQGTS